jgi:hypothetical protein
VRYILLDLARPPADFIPGWSGPLAADDLFEVWENPDWLGDAVAWSAAARSDDPAELLRTDPASMAQTALVDDPAAVLDCADDCDPVGLDVRRPRPERIEISTDADRATLVSVSQQALPGWTLTVDGVEADVVEVDGLFLGAVVPPGEHEVVFTYESPWLTATLVLSLLAIAATIGLVVADTVQTRRRIQAAGGGDR